MSDNTIDFPGSTKADLPVEVVLEGAAKSQLRVIFIIGVDAEDDTIRLFSTTSERSTMIGLAQLAIHELLNV